MPPTVLALGLDPAAADPAELTGLAPDLVRAFIDTQLQRLGAVGYEVTTCFVDRGATAEAVVSRALQERRFDCVMFGAGLRAPAHLPLFEKLLNLVHAQAPGAKLCFNTTPADTAGAVQRWVSPRA